MRRSDWVMKLLLVLPVLLLIVLLSGITMDWWRVNHGATESGHFESLTQQQKKNVPVESVGEAGTSQVLRLGTEESGQGESIQEESIQHGGKGDAADPELNEGPVPEDEKTGDDQTADQDIHLLFGGDVYLSVHVLAAYDKAGGIQGVLDEGYLREIRNSDIFMVNHEFPFSTRGAPAADKEYTYRLPPERVSIMNELGIDIVSLANNHTLDYGTDALLDTFTVLDGAGIPYVGAGADLDRAKKLITMEVSGRTVGYLAASRVYPDWTWEAGGSRPGMVSGYKPEVLLEEVKRAGDFCDYLVVYVHWGDERSEAPNEKQTTLGKQLVDAGADLVVGSHPHVFQGIEYYKGKPIVYSLGNFVFGSSIPRTGLLRADIDLDQGQTRLSIVPGTSGAGYTRTLTDEEKIREFYEYLEGISFGITIDGAGNIHPPA